MSVLSKPEILKHYKNGLIIIEPFNRGNLNSTSYDVRLGEYFYRQNQMERTEILNPFSKDSINKIYSKLEKAIEVRKIKSQLNAFENLKSTDRVILISPNETILAHTIEFIGGKNSKDWAITSEMRARSSLGRIGIAVCKCAGWGDVGYINRWTMEITNFSSVVISLVVGMRIAQIIFHQVGPVSRIDEYQLRGKYQKSIDIKSLKKNWQPEMMLPKLYQDKDLGKFKKYWK